MARSRTLVCSACTMLVVLAGECLVAQGTDCDGWVALHDMMPRRSPIMLRTGPEEVFLFGGSLGGSNPVSQDPATATNETWRFTDGRWRFVTTSGPSPRFATAGAFDVARGTVVLFGGAGNNPVNGANTLFNETWEFVNGQWSLRTTSRTPGGRYGHAMAYDPSRNVTFLYGGINATTQFWSYDGTDWTEIPLTTPNPGSQSNHRLVVDPRDNSLVLFPANASTPVWKWNGAAWSQQPATGITSTSAFFDEALQTFVLTNNFGAFFSYNGAAAVQVAPSLPNTSTQLLPTAVPISSGWLTTISPFNFTTTLPYHYRVSIDNGWRAIPSKPQPLATQDMAFGLHNPTSEFVLFGGISGFGTSTPIAETWILRGETWRQHTGAGPQGRNGSYLAFLPQRNATLLLGGNFPGTTLWSWNGNGWTSQPTGGTSITPGTPPDYVPQRNAILWPSGSTLTRINSTSTGTIPLSTVTTQNGAAAYDPIRGGLIYTAGQSSSGTFKLIDATQGSGFAWQSVIAGTSTGRWGTRMAFDPDRAGLVLFGGFTGGSVGIDVSSFPRKTYFLGSTATAWTTLALAFNGPIGRKFQGMGYDPAAKRIVMYGGLTHGSTAPLRETWKLARGPAAVALEPAETFVVPGQTAELFIIASGGGVIEYQWFKDGQPLANSSRITGADSDTLQIRAFSSADDGEYSVSVRNPCGNDQSVLVLARAIPDCPGDFDNSGGVDGADIAAFFAAFERGLMLADVDLSGGIDGTDLAVFFTSFESGGC